VNGIDLRRTVGWTISQHAKEAAARRGVQLRTILECIAEPELTYPDRAEQEIVARGRLALVIDRLNQVVVTVLVTGPEAWTDADARAVFA
jgi:hypothetical protein